MKKTVLHPSLKESVLLVLWTSIAALFGYVAYSSAWSLGYTGTISSDVAVVSRFEPDAMSYGLFIIAILIFATAFEVLWRSVTIEEASISSRSMLGIYRQVLVKAEITDFRITPILGWGRILEARVKGRWIVFLVNSRFKDSPCEYLGEEIKSNLLARATPGLHASMSELGRSARIGIKRIGKLLAAFAVVYGALWGLTIGFGGRLLERHLYADLQREWRDYRDLAEIEGERFPGMKERAAFAGGPSLRIRVISCPAPFICYAAVDRAIGGLNGRGAVGKYFVTPWRTYLLHEDGTWVS